MNSVNIIGNLTRDPEVRQTPSGTSVCEFSIAVNDGYGEKQHTSFIDVTAWQKQAENVGKYLEKGSKVGVEGSLRQDRWEASDGGKRSKLKVNAFRVHFLGQPKRREPEPELPLAGGGRSVEEQLKDCPF